MKSKQACILLILMAVLIAAPAYTQEIKLGDPLYFQDSSIDKQVSKTMIEPENALLSKTSLAVNIQNIEEIRSFYQTNYLTSEGKDIEWTGDISTCTAGTNSQDFTDAVMLRVNYYRTMAGLPEISFVEEYNLKSMSSSLMMSANSSLSHYPPDTWSCYSAEGAQAAGSSNLSLGHNGWNAVTGQMQDAGSNNSAAGHRRWILYPPRLEMGTGSVPSSDGYWPAMTLWVFGASGTRPDARDEFVAWPPPGYVPYPVVYARWSFSYPGADFSSASLSMTCMDEAIPVSVEVIANGYGDNTLVWIPNNMSNGDSWPAEDLVTYTVELDNVMIDSTPRSFTYDVHVFHPDIDLAPVTKFTSDTTARCTGSVMFQDQSENNPTSWEWSFPGGSPSVSSLQNPDITYDVPGIYSVTLTASNSVGDGNTLSKTGYITIYEGALPSVCAPLTLDAGFYQMGIYNVTLNTINHSTGNAASDDGYQDFACTQITALEPGNTYPFSVTVGSYNPEHIKIYMDYNNDGDFLDSGENIFSSASSATGTHSGEITIPASPAILDTITRMRVISDFGTLSSDPCSDLTYGQAEDYGIIIKNEVESIAGDVDGNGHLDLADAIFALQVICNMTPEYPNLNSDVNGDAKIGLEEVVYVLEKVAGTRE